MAELEEANRELVEACLELEEADLDPEASLELEEACLELEATKELQEAWLVGPVENVEELVDEYQEELSEPFD